MPAKPTNELTRRELQIMEIIHVAGESTAADICAALDHELSNSAVRTFLRILEQKGRLEHRRDGIRYSYRPVESPIAAKQNALQRVLKTFFNGSLASAAQMLVESEGKPFSEEEIDRLESIVHAARERRELSPKSK